MRKGWERASGVIGSLPRELMIALIVAIVAPPMLAGRRGASTRALGCWRGMTDNVKIAKSLERFAQAVAAHDRENPTHTAYGIGLAHFDMERLGFEGGEEVLPGITIHVDGGVSGNFRVLCDAEHDEGQVEVEEEALEAIATRWLPGSAPRHPNEQ